MQVCSLFYVSFFEFGLKGTFNSFSCFILNRYYDCDYAYVIDNLPFCSDFRNSKICSCCNEFKIQHLNRFKYKTSFEKKFFSGTVIYEHQAVVAPISLCKSMVEYVK